jgi:hypothetical protein
MAFYKKTFLHEIFQRRSSKNVYYIQFVTLLCNRQEQLFNDSLLIGGCCLGRLVIAHSTKDQQEGFGHGNFDKRSTGMKY